MQLEQTARWSDGAISLFLLTPEAVSEAYVGWLADPLVNRYLESRFKPQPHEAVMAFVSELLASPRDAFFGVRDEELGRHVGNIRLAINHDHRRGEIGILIGDRAAWGRGVGTRAIARIVDIAQNELGLRKLSAGCYASNTGSRKAFEKAGFGLEARRPQHVLLDDGTVDDELLLGLVLERRNHERPRSANVQGLSNGR